MPLTENTKKSIEEYLTTELTTYVKDANKKRTEKPFHERLMPALAAVPFSERSFSTRTGSWLQSIALIIARQFHKEAHLNHLASGNIQPAATAHITAILEQMDHGSPRRIPDRAKDTAQVLGVQSPGGALREVRSDLYILRNDGLELYFEMKTPWPNKGQCKAMKQDILLITALRYESKAEAFAAAAYNPYGEGNPYRAPFVPQFLEVDKDLIVGRAFWTRIGDASTYDELLELAAKVGAEVHKAV